MSDNYNIVKMRDPLTCEIFTKQEMQQINKEFKQMVTDVNKIIEEVNDGKINKDNNDSNQVNNVINEAKQEKSIEDRINEVIANLNEDEAKQYTYSIKLKIKKQEELLKFKKLEVNAPNSPFSNGSIDEKGREVLNKIPLNLYLEKIEEMTPSPELIKSLIDVSRALDNTTKEVLTEYEEVTQFIQKCTEDDNISNDYTRNELDFYRQKEAFYNVNKHLKPQQTLKIDDEGLPVKDSKDNVNQ